MEHMFRFTPSTLFLLFLIFCTGYHSSRIVHAQRNLEDRPRKDMYGPLDVYFEDLHMMAEGKEYFMKGISYNPFPLGVQSMNTTGINEGFGGGGFCSAKTTVHGEDKSACFGSDLFDGAVARTERWPPGPVGPWWKSVWRRDFAILKELGVNTLRIYNLNPFTKHLLMTRDNIADIKSPESGAEHLPFLDYAHENGFKVILPVVTDKEVLMSESEQFMMDTIESQVEELGAHPALLAFMVGNELDLRGQSNLLRDVNKIMHRLRQYSMEYWNRIIPVSTALIDIPTDFNWAIRELDVDFITINTFRGLAMAGLFDSSDSRFMGWAAASKEFNLPLLVGEFGEHHQTRSNSEVPDWFNQQWKAFIDNVDNGVIGAIFFEYSDEPYTKAIEQQDMGLVQFEPSKDHLTNDTSLEPNIWVPDKVIEKDIIYRAVQNGDPSSSFSKYNMNADVWQLIGREPIQSNNYDPNQQIPEHDQPDGRPRRTYPNRPRPGTGSEPGPYATGTKVSHWVNLALVISFSALTVVFEVLL